MVGDELHERGIFEDGGVMVPAKSFLLSPATWCEKELHNNADVRAEATAGCTS